RYVVRSAAPGANTPAAVAVSPDGGRALAITGQRTATLGGGASHALAGPGVPVRAAAITGPGRGWAIADSGQLLANEGGKWTLPGERSGLAGLLGVRRSLGAAALSGGSVPGAGSPGFAALAFRSSSEGYAVGSRGLIDRYDGSKWVAEEAPTSADLSGVAAGSGGGVAVGAAGALLERPGGSWRIVADAPNLGARQDLMAA